jgi:hypothetical protein
MGLTRLILRPLRRGEEPSNARIQEIQGTFGPELLEFLITQQRGSTVPAATSPKNLEQVPNHGNGSHD